ncbi:hypothetical protein V9T40_012004 [Parthenolecanium corni]|uniref:Uncharacterized protein n=1 Tax=Parthenolecanium corni TaxID=536013 RepID=A0AAN9Y031_9HEMI
MSNKSIAGKAKKFKGFTNLFKNAKAKPAKAPDPEASKKPFAGFTEAYKHFKPPEYDEYGDEDEDGMTFIMTPAAVAEEVKKVKIEYKHFVPTKYNEWRDERLDAVEEKLLAAGPKVDQGPAEMGGAEMGDRGRPRRSSRGSEEPMWAAGAGAAENFDEIFRTKLPPFRELNEYPMKYQLQKINDRMNRYLASMDECDASCETASHSSYCRPHGMAPKLNTRDAHQRRLKEYFNRNVKWCRTKPVDFRRQHFHEWCSKFTFNYERKFKNMPDVAHTLYREDFGSWYDRVCEKVENKYRNVPVNMTRQDIMATHAYLGDARRPQQPKAFEDSSDASLSGTFPSLSHCESCREMCG